MIFGQTHEQLRTKRLLREQWHTWFAWYPVQLMDGRRAWLQYVRRKRHWHIGRLVKWEYCGHVTGNKIF